MAKSKGGRPKVQHVVHTLKLDDDLLELAKNTLTAKIAVDGVSKPLSALLSHPAGLIALGIAASFAGYTLTPEELRRGLTADILMANPAATTFLGFLDDEQREAVKTAVKAALKSLGL